MTYNQITANIITEIRALKKENETLRRREKDLEKNVLFWEGKAETLRQQLKEAQDGCNTHLNNHLACLDKLAELRKGDEPDDIRLKVWQAACKWQKQKDAEICIDESRKMHWPKAAISNDCEACAYSILNQS